MSESDGLQEKMLALAAQRQHFEQAKTYAYAYLDGIFEKNVYPAQAALDNLKFFDEALPQNPGDPAAILRMLHEYGSPATVATTGGRYFGMVVGGVFPPVMAVKWLVELLGLPSETVAGFVSGTSMATLCGLAAWRYELLRRGGWDVNAQGLFGAPPFRVVVGAEAHSTVFKALALLGLGKEWVELAPVDEQGRMRVDLLPQLDSNTLLILQAGNVNSGSFDPMDELCERGQAAGAWVHIDGAFGLWAAMQATGSYIIYGEERDGMLYILNEVAFNQVLVAGDTPEQTAAVLQNLQQSGECWCGGAKWHATPVIRVSVCSWATTPEDIRRTVRAFVKARV